MSVIQAYPLHWPEGTARTSYWNRRCGQFKTTFARARDSLLWEVKKLGGTDPIISSNMQLRADGLPRAAQSVPNDPGIAIYFTYKSQQMCFACDQYLTVADNTQAIRKTIEALRGIERWGASDMMEKAFKGFIAIEPPSTDWRSVLDSNDPQGSYKRLRSAHHPDKGGDSSKFNQIQRAYEQFLSEQ